MRRLTSLSLVLDDPRPFLVYHYREPHYWRRIPWPPGYRTWNPGADYQVKLMGDDRTRPGH